MARCCCLSQKSLRPLPNGGNGQTNSYGYRLQSLHQSVSQVLFNAAPRRTRTVERTAALPAAAPAPGSESNTLLFHVVSG